MTGGLLCLLIICIAVILQSMRHHAGTHLLQLSPYCSSFPREDLSVSPSKLASSGSLAEKTNSLQPGSKQLPRVWWIHSSLPHSQYQRPSGSMVSMLFFPRFRPLSLSSCLTVLLQTSMGILSMQMALINSRVLSISIHPPPDSSLHFSSLFFSSVFMVSQPENQLFSLPLSPEWKREGLRPAVIL